MPDREMVLRSVAQTSGLSDFSSSFRVFPWTGHFKGSGRTSATPRQFLRRVRMWLRAWLALGRTD